MDAPRYVIGALGGAILVVLAGTVGLVASHDAPQRAHAAAPTTPTSRLPVATTPPLHTWPVDVQYPLPRYPAGSPVGEAVAGLRAAGAEVTVFDARLWDRTVQPDWALCTQSELFWGDDVWTGEVQLYAVPAGDPCP